MRVPRNSENRHERQDGGGKMEAGEWKWGNTQEEAMAGVDCEKTALSHLALRTDANLRTPSVISFSERVP